MNLKPINTEFHVHIESFNSPFNIINSGKISEFFFAWNKRCISFKNDTEVCKLIHSAISYYQQNALEYLELLFCPVGFESDGGQTEKYYKFWKKVIKDNGLENNIKVILDFPFQSIKQEHIISISNALKYLGKDNLISGISFGGLEFEGFLSNKQYIIDFLKESELHFSTHLGETMYSVKNLNDVVELGMVKRIAHFTQFLKKSGSLNIIKENNICLDLCPIPNIKMGLINDINELNISQLISVEIPFTINSDNPDIFLNSFRSTIESIREENILDYMETTNINQYSSRY